MADGEDAIPLIEGAATAYPEHESAAAVLRWLARAEEPDLLSR